MFLPKYNLESGIFSEKINIQPLKYLNNQAQRLIQDWTFFSAHNGP